jgi:hypothetical protein
VTPSVAVQSTTSSAKRLANAIIEALQEQAMGRKRARRSPRTFSCLSILALVEIQLVLRILVHGKLYNPICPEVFAVPHVQAIHIHPPFGDCYTSAANGNIFLPLLRHPAAQQLRSFDISRTGYYKCAPEELQQLAALPHLHSLSLSCQ